MEPNARTARSAADRDAAERRAAERIQRDRERHAAAIGDAAAGQGSDVDSLTLGGLAVSSPLPSGAGVEPLPPDSLTLGGRNVDVSAGDFEALRRHLDVYERRHGTTRGALA